MTQVMEMDRAVEARRRGETEMLERKQKLMQEREMLRRNYLMMRSELETLHRKTEELEHDPERKPEVESQLEQMKVRIERLQDGLCSSESKLARIEDELAELDTKKIGGGSTSFNRDLLLEALDDDAANELYAQGARMYARRLADRVRDGEFDGD